MNPDEAADRFPVLWQFFGTYFHQDWPEEFPTWQDAVDAFARQATDEELDAADAELRLLSKEPPVRSSEVLEALGCYYRPAADGLTVADWIRAVESHLPARRYTDIGD